MKKSFRTPEGEKLSVLDIPEFSLEPQQCLALEGQSGSGKTTLLNCISGIQNPDSGSLVLDGSDLVRMSESQRDRFRARTLGYVFQSFQLLEGLTARENIELGMVFGAGRVPGRADELLARVGLSSRADYLPRQLSLGQQQRVAVARALVNRPKLVLADEPTGNLDPKTAVDVLELIRETCEEFEAALILVSHSEEVLSQFEDRQDLREWNRAASTRTEENP